jgi:hypothetical protein
MEDLPDACDYIRGRLSSPDREIVLDLLDVMHDFQTTGEKYQKKYGLKLQ